MSLKVYLQYKIHIFWKSLRSFDFLGNLLVFLMVLYSYVIGGVLFDYYVSTFFKWVVFGSTLFVLFYQDYKSYISHAIGWKRKQVKEKALEVAKDELE